MYKNRIIKIVSAKKKLLGHFNLAEKKIVNSNVSRIGVVNCGNDLCLYAVSSHSRSVHVQGDPKIARIVLIVNILRQFEVLLSSFNRLTETQIIVEITVMFRGRIESRVK